MLCGGIAGMIAKTATNPLERIKMLSQTGEHGVVVATTAVGGAATTTTATASSSNMLSIYRSIIRHEGVLGLWAGNGANLLRVVPSKAVVFSSNDFYKSMFRRHLQQQQQHGGSAGGAGGTSHTSRYSSNYDDATVPLPPQYAFLAGGLAGMSATAATYPLDLARGRISGKLAFATTSVGSNKKVYTGILQTIMVTVKDEGIAGLYKGMTPTLLGAMPYVGIQFGTVGLLERMIPIPHNDDDNVAASKTKEASASSSLSSPALRKTLFGGMGGVAAGLVTYPNDTVRRMLQLQGSRGTPAAPHGGGYWDTLFHILQHGGGVRRLYRGLGVNLLRMAPNTAVQFGSYELLKQLTADWAF